MRISTRGRYALRILIDLAQHKDQPNVAVRAISERQNISDKYIEQIMTQLKRAGLVKSSRGAQGGYSLTKEPGDYLVGDVLRLMEGCLAPVDCVSRGKSCQRTENCYTLPLWKELDKAVSSVIDKYTIQDLLAGI